MAKESKDGISVSFYLEKPLVEEFKDFCKDTGRTQTKVVELAIREYMDNHSEKKS